MNVNYYKDQLQHKGFYCHSSHKYHCLYTIQMQQSVDFDKTTRFTIMEFLENSLHFISKENVKNSSIQFEYDTLLKH